MRDPGLLLSDTAVLAIYRIAAGTFLVQPWSDADAWRMRQQAGRLLHQSSDAALFLAPHAKALVGNIALVPVFGPANGAFGPAWPGHPFHSPAMHVGYKLREADLTRELAALMGPSSGRRGAERAVSFLRIIAELANRPAIAETLNARARPIVSAEHPVTTGRTSGKKSGSGAAATILKKGSAPRIDLMFEWPLLGGPRQAVVVIEAKLGASVADGQLKPYSEEAKRRAKGGPLALVLLTAQADKAERRHRAWAAVRWFALMRRWEHVLAAAGDDDAEFARVRAHVWRYILSSGGVYA